MTLNEVSLTAIDWRALPKKVLVAALIGGCIALVLEPDHTSDLPILAAFGLWSPHILFAAALFLAGLAVFQRLGLPALLPAVASTLLLPVLFAPVSLLLDYGFGKPDEELVAALHPVKIYISEVMAVAPVALTVALVVVFILARAAPVHDGHTEATRPSLKSLIDTVPLSLGDDIIRMHAQDHYVELVTTNGSVLLTEQFGDCVERLTQLGGVQCHRSHWISLDHVRDLARSGSAYLCTMSNGDQVPVSRRRYSELKARLSMRDIPSWRS
ncbi:LytTR family DNA-binding domain-containing protein [Pelagibius sp. Alg239-R121]|uniref:LytTR family DNA-binding domain-containing protein n=1 Tax=Pelagibius sp. Alg239-R121 TaxID=2993448 RepID=UPI0024A6CAE8|nr:LytTR family DNA-binding domain-containing protein [Pelagibius sp. Alg239-R121]